MRIALVARIVVGALLVAGVLAGCKKSADAPTAPVTTPATPPVAVTPAPDATPAPAAQPGGATETSMPKLSIATLDGSQYDIASHRGKWVVVNFWATWCGPCLKEMPELSALDAMHEHIEVIGLAYEDIEVAAMRDFLKQHPVVYPIAIVDTYAPPADFDTPRGLPMTYLIAPDGVVAKKVIGPVTAKEIETAIAAAGGPAVDPESGNESS